jgi:hypothetical protein
LVTRKEGAVHLTNHGDFDGLRALFAGEVIYDVSASAASFTGISVEPELLGNAPWLSV